MATAKTTTAKAKAAAKQTTETVETAMTEAAEAVADAFGVKGLEIPEFYRSFAETGASRVREHYAQFKANAEEATDVIEETYDTARDGLIDLQHKTLDVARQNTDATFDFVKQIVGVTSVADAVQLQAKFARQQFDACADYSKEIQTSIVKIAEDTVAPSRTAFAKAFGSAK